MEDLRRGKKVEKGVVKFAPLMHLFFDTSFLRFLGKGHLDRIYVQFSNDNERKNKYARRNSDLTPL